MNCFICNKKFDEEQVLLPCFHGFCSKCFSGDKCPQCNAQNENRIIPVFKLFPIPNLLQVLESLGFKYLTLHESENFYIIDPEKCCECRSYFGKPFVCVNLNTKTRVLRNLCSLCSSLVYDPQTNLIKGHEDVFFETIEKNSVKMKLPSNYELIGAFYGQTISSILLKTKKLLACMTPNCVISESDCERFFQIINDCRIPHEKSGLTNQLLHIVAPYCLRWHKVPSLNCILKDYMQSAFGYAFDGDRRTINITIVAQFLFCLRNKTMDKFDWICSNAYPDDSYYVRKALESK